MFFRKEKEYVDNVGVKKEPISVRKYRIIGHSVEYSCGSYRSYITYIDNGLLENVEVSGGAEVEDGVINMVGSYAEITEYESELDREMRICVGKD